MKLLFDQNLSPRLPRTLPDIYPESVHVRRIENLCQIATEVWHIGVLSLLDGPDRQRLTVGLKR
jgi:predicted nuclease of predicted toxin-antitoxin system